jgi:hypothetical protein
MGLPLFLVIANFYMEFLSSRPQAGELRNQHMGTDT